MSDRAIFDKQLALKMLQFAELPSIQQENQGEFPIPKGFQLAFPFKSLFPREWYGFTLQSKNAVVTAFRGTKTPLDWLEDAHLLQVPLKIKSQHVSDDILVHDGFQYVYDTCRPHIKGVYTHSIIDAYKKTVHDIEEKTLYITGHSLGAAVATLHALDVVLSGMNFKNIIMYNFASPKVGNLRFNMLYDSHVPKSMRVVNNYDLVPHLPCTPTVFGEEYYHIKPSANFTLPDMHAPNSKPCPPNKGKKYTHIGYNHSFNAYERGIKEYL